MSARHARRRLLLALATPLGVAALTGGGVDARQAAVQDDDSVDVPLKTTAALAVAFSFQTQTNLGMAADAFVHKVYDKGTCEQVLKSALGFLMPIVGQLEDVSELELDEADKAFFEKLVEALRLLRDEAEALGDFIRSSKEADRKKYLDLRDQAKGVLDGVVKGAS
jgi:hypothetical protein